MATSLKKNKRFLNDPQGYARKLGFRFKVAENNHVTVQAPKQGSLTIASLTDYFRKQKNVTVVA